MSKTLKKLTKGVEVFIIDETSIHAGKLAVVGKRIMKPVDADTVMECYDVRVEGRAHDITFRRSALLPATEADAATAQDLLLMRQAKEREAVDQERAWGLKQRAAMIEKYVAQRQEMAAREFSIRTEEAEGRIHFDVLNESAHIRDQITMYHRIRKLTASIEYPPEVTVSWSALGASTPEEALHFGRSLVEVAERALRRRAELEATQPDLLAQLPIA